MRFDCERMFATLVTPGSRNRQLMDELFGLRSDLARMSTGSQAPLGNADSLSVYRFFNFIFMVTYYRITNSFLHPSRHVQRTAPLKANCRFGLLTHSTGLQKSS